MPKSKRTYSPSSPVPAIGLLAAMLSTTASAVPYYYTDWTSWNPGGGTAQGVITLPDTSTVNVSFDAITSAGGAGTFLGVAGSALWSPTTAYTSSQVDNAPGFEGIQLVGENNMTYRVTLSAPIKDPLMVVTTLGSLGIPATYVFNAPFTILSQGPTCCWGSGTLQQLNSTTVQGNEGAGTLQFIGTYSTFAWTMPNREYWHAFTFGIRTTEALEPTPPSNVPEPGMLALLGAGLTSLAAVRRKRAA